jgi:hypothetical protein
MPADVRERYEKLQQNDLPSVAPETDADEEGGDGDEDEDDAMQSTDTVFTPPYFQCVIRSAAGNLKTTNA